MDMNLIITAGGTVVTIIGANIALISWLRSDVKSFESEVRQWRDEIMREQKRFHGRLCALDERTKKTHRHGQRRGK